VVERIGYSVRDEKNAVAAAYEQLLPEDAARPRTGARSIPASDSLSSPRLRGTRVQRPHYGGMPCHTTAWSCGSAPRFSDITPSPISPDEDDARDVNSVRAVHEGLLGSTDLWIERSRTRETTHEFVMALALHDVRTTQGRREMKTLIVVAGMVASLVVGCALESREPSRSTTQCRVAGR
jgi:hypothetical protein